MPHLIFTTSYQSALETTFMFKDRYIWLCFALTLLVASFFLGDILRAPNEFHFSKGGDGLQTYYQSIYHLKYDSSAFHQQGLNYPYGESIFFTGGQPFTSNVIRMLIPAVDLSDHMVGITNGMMLVSIFLCAIFLYLIFKELDVTRIFAVLFAVGLTFITQQWDRFGGHFPLAYLYAVPGMIYFLIRFYQRPAWKWSFILCLYMLFLIFAHIYYLVFFAVIAFGFWLAFVALNKKRNMSVVQSVLHVGLQLIVPFLILQAFISFSSDVLDRPKIPWGFMVYRSGIGSYLFPYGQWYQHWFDGLRPRFDMEWEGLSYIGGVAILLLVLNFFSSTILFKRVYGQIVRWQNKTFIALAIASVLCIAVSFAFPFNYDLDRLLHRMGSIQQFRGIGRFAFVAFYLINVLLIALFWKLPFFHKNVKYAFSVLLLLLMGSEAKMRTGYMSNSIRNERGNVLRPGEIEGLEAIAFNEFQAMIPFPFFHVGSENIGMVCAGEFMGHVYDISVKTGLPTFAASMSRTSLDQTFNNMALAKEYLEVPGVIDDLKSELPILLICDTAAMTLHQKQLLRFATPIAAKDKYVYYSIPVKGFEQQWKSNRDSLNSMDFSSFKKSEGEVYVSSAADSVEYHPEGHTFKMSYDWVTMIEREIPSNWQGKKMLISFWIKNFKRDLIPRTTLEVIQKNGEETTGYMVQTFDGRYVATRGEDALVEYQIDFDPTTMSIKFSLQNKLLKGVELEYSDLIIRPEGVDCLILQPKSRRYNNRIYQ
jgi:hypothetical protein